MAKPEHEYSRRAGRLHPCAGLVPGLTERILAADPDGGVATQMLCFELGTDPPGQGGLGGQCRQEHL